MRCSPAAESGRRCSWAAEGGPVRPGAPRGAATSSEAPDQWTGPQGAHISGRPAAAEGGYAAAAATNSCSSASSWVRSLLQDLAWIWQTRLSVTPRISPISRSVRL